MQIGFILPQIGKAAGVQIIIDIAQGAEAAGLDSLWVTDRLLWPIKPQTPYPGAPDGLLPEAYQRVFDPLSVLAFVASCTSSIKLGTCVLNVPFYPPVLLARQLATIDQFSSGRLSVGLGLGWSQDEFIAIGASGYARGRQCEEFVHVLNAIWNDEVVQCAGSWYSIPPSIIDLKPVQQHLPILLASNVEQGVVRAATIGDGWISIGLSLPQLSSMMSQFQAHACAAGRDLGALQTVVRLPVTLSSFVADTDRPLGTGCLEQVVEDLEALADAGVDEVIVDPTFSEHSQSIDGWLSVLEQVKIVAGRSRRTRGTATHARSLE